MRVLFLLFIVAPVLEMWLLIEVGAMIGALPTIGCVVLTAIIGASMLRQQGFATLFRAQQRLDQGQIPLQEMMEGLVLAVGGALLLTPGFITDALGFACLIAPLRGKIIAAVIRSGVVNMTGPGSAPGAGPFQRPPGADTRDSGNVTIEGDYRREE